MSNLFSNINGVNNYLIGSAPKIDKTQVAKIDELVKDNNPVDVRTLQPVGCAKFKDSPIYKAGKSVFDYLEKNKEDIQEGSLFGVLGKEKSSTIAKAAAGSLFGIGGKFLQHMDKFLEENPEVIMN